MGSDVHIQSAGEKYKLGDLHLAFVMDKVVAKERAHWWRPDMKDKRNTDTRKDPGASFVMNEGGPALFAWVAEERNRNLGQESTEVDGARACRPCAKEERQGIGVAGVV